MKILICGAGFVGKAHALAFGSNNEVHMYDPAYDMYKERFKNPDAVIIAVSTPMAEDFSCNMNNVYDAIENVYSDDIPILIKSTISLEGWRLIKRAFPNMKITFSPEFLRAAHAYEDFKNQKEIYMGGGDTDFWVKLFKTSIGKSITISTYDPEVLILTKYFRNSFLATKVAFFNQMYDLCISANVHAESVLNLTAEDERIGKSHSIITEDRGFGGHCFPKDTSAIVRTAQDFKVHLSLINEAIAYNNKVRNEN